MSTRLDQTAMMSALIHGGLWHAAAHARLADASYAPPRLDWLTGEFDRWYRQALRAFAIEAYVAESGDCDDYADLYAALARICHRRMPDSAGAGLPVGVLHYVSLAGPHAVVLAITSDAGVVAIEPQRPGHVLTLTRAERSSAWLLKI
jgi:hypothetical protein